MKVSLLAVLAVTVFEPFDAERLPNATVSLAFTAYSSDPARVSVEGANTTRVEEIWIAMQDARVRPAAACKRAAARFVVAGGFKAEIVKRQTAALDATQLQIDRYCAFEVELRRARGKLAGAPSEFRGASIVIRGRRADGVAFVLQSRAQPSPLLRARDLHGFTVTAPSASWILGIDLARWFAGVDLSACEVSGEAPDRVLRIDERTNPELLAAFNANVEAGLALFEDANRDRNLDPEEQKAPLAVNR